MTKLENIAKENAKEYYTTGKQNLSDDVFDAIVDKIREQTPSSDVLTTGWGYSPVENKDKIKHRYCHIGSLSKIKSINHSSKLCHISAKIDGISCVCYYANSELILALTRGNGEYGIDITEKIKHIKGSQVKLTSSNFTGAIRGEICMTPADFETYKQLRCQEAKNARNSTAGIINSDKISDEDYKYLSYYVYTVIADETEHTDSVEDLYNFLDSNFEFVAPNTFENLSSHNYEHILKHLKALYETLVNIDGLVITEPKVTQNNDGVYSYNQKAFKFEDEVKISTVHHIEWTLSKNQAYIPVVCIEPIELEGTTVKRVTGYNAKWIKDMKIEAGLTVAVRKANQIIPQIIQVL